METTKGLKPGDKLLHSRGFKATVCRVVDSEHVALHAPWAGRDRIEMSKRELVIPAKNWEKQ